MESYGTKVSPRRHHIALAKSQQHVVDPTNPRGTLDDSVEDWLNVSGRAADDAEHLGGCRLMLQRLAQFGVTLLQFLEQPDILNRDHGLISEGLEESDLLIGERIDFGTANENRSNRNILAHQRHSKLGSISFINAGLGDLRKLSCGYSQQILNMDWL